MNVAKFEEVVSSTKVSSLTLAKNFPLFLKASAFHSSPSTSSPASMTLINPSSSSESGQPEGGGVRNRHSKTKNEVHRNLSYNPRRRPSSTCSSSSDSSFSSTSSSSSSSSVESDYTSGAGGLPVVVNFRPCSPATGRGSATPSHVPSPAMVAGSSHSTTGYNYPSLDPGAVDLEVKIILLGDYSVGKSSLLRVLARQSTTFADESLNQLMASSVSNASRGAGARSPLVRSSLQPGGFVEVEFSHQDKTVLAKIADTGGQERYRSMTTSYYRGAHGCLLMFDVTKEESFANLDTWIENIDSYRTHDLFSCIIVGTRCKSPARRIMYERAAEFAESRGFPYLELDMDHMTDVRRVFGALLDSVSVNLLNLRAPIAITIRPEISNREISLRKNVVCSC